MLIDAYMYSEKQAYLRVGIVASTIVKAIHPKAHVKPSDFVPIVMLEQTPQEQLTILQRFAGKTYD